MSIYYSIHVHVANTVFITLYITYVIAFVIILTRMLHDNQEANGICIVNLKIDVPSLTACFDL